MNIFIEFVRKHDTAIWLSLLLAVIVLFWLKGRLQSRRDWKKRSFSQKLETILLPRETVKVICPQKKGSCILTNKRLLLENKEGFTAVKLTDIQKIKGLNASGNRTTAAKNMVSLTVSAEKELSLENTGSEFEAMVKQLQAKMDRKRRSKAKK